MEEDSEMKPETRNNKTEKGKREREGGRERKKQDWEEREIKKNGEKWVYVCVRACVYSGGWALGLPFSSALSSLSLTNSRPKQQ